MCNSNLKGQIMTSYTLQKIQILVLDLVEKTHGNRELERRATRLQCPLYFGQGL